MFDVNETLKSADLPADVLPQLLYAELLTGVQKARVFRESVQVDESLIGQQGTKLTIPFLATRFTAGTISESTLDSTGYSVTSPVVDTVDCTIGSVVYVAFRLSDILKEDSPKYDYLAILLRDAGRAIAEYEDTEIRDCLVSGVGNTISSAKAGELAYDDIIDLLEKHKEDSFYPSGDYLPFLYVHPLQEADLLKDTKFLSSARYAVSDLGSVASSDTAAQETIYANCRVRVTENMLNYAALLVFPPHPVYGPVEIHAYKRTLLIKNQREELYAREIATISQRYGDCVVSANGIGLISNC